MAIPNRWEEYQNIGDRIEGTRFIAFKVPLKDALCRKVVHQFGEESRFGPKQLLEDIEKKGLKLGLIIDLTNTTRYYSPEVEFDDRVKYMKIFTQGHLVPSHDVIQQFSETVDDFLQENTDDDTVVGVHCTHGVNRSGYLICRYMIDKMKMEPETTIREFNKARKPHCIERENYLDDLNNKTSSLPGSLLPSSRSHAQIPWQEKRDMSYNYHYYDDNNGIEQNGYQATRYNNYQDSYNNLAYGSHKNLYINRDSYGNQYGYENQNGYGNQQQNGNYKCDPRNENETSRYDSYREQSHNSRDSYIHVNQQRDMLQNGRSYSNTQYCGGRRETYRSDSYNDNQSSRHSSRDDGFPKRGYSRNYRYNPYSTQYLRKRNL